jgi:hypothetical protein
MSHIETSLGTNEGEWGIGGIVVVGIVHDRLHAGGFSLGAAEAPGRSRLSYLSSQGGSS